MNDNRPDLVRGYAEIGEHLGMNERQAKYLAETDETFPSFTMGGGRIVCSLRSRLDQWLADKAAQKNIEGQGDGEK